MAKKKDLGKGIRALISGIDNPSEKSTTKEKPLALQTTSSNYISIDNIETNPYQPRNEFDEEALANLIASIKIHGIIQPITVNKIGPGTYRIISGERRFRAAKSIGLKEVPVFVREAGDQELLEMALIENIQRADLNPIEIAISYQRLIDEFDLTHDTVSDRVGKKRSTISNYLRLLKLSPAAQNALRANKIFMGHAKVLAGIDNPSTQLSVLNAIIDQNLSVRQAENLLNQKTKSPKKATPSGSTTGHSSEMKKIIDQLSEKFGTKVKVNRDKNGSGKIEIGFQSDDHFNHILDNIID
jgi:ParB family chromosome partitioning protein